MDNDRCDAAGMPRPAGGLHRGPVAGASPGGPAASEAHEPDCTVRALMSEPGLPRLEARMLMSHVLGRPQAWLLAHDTDPVQAAAAAEFRDLAARRLAGQPM